MKKTLFLKLLATKKLEIDDGLIELGDSHFNLMPTIFVSSLIEYFARRNRLEELYIISWFWGYDVVHQVIDTLNLEKEEEIYQVGMSFAESQGLGLYRTNDYVPGEYTRFKIKTNPYLENLKLDNVETPIDHFIAGAMGGGGAHVHGALTNCIEVKCKAVGSQSCEFITGTKEELKNRGLWEKASDRYKLDKYSEFQQKVMDEYHHEDSKEFIKLLNEQLE